MERRNDAPSEDAMSLDATGCRIMCDNRECGAATPVPIRVKRAMDADRSGSSSASGWMFVAGTYEPRHYCPRCANKLSPAKQS